MKKKKILLLTSIASIAAFSAAAVIFSSRTNLAIKAEPEINYYSIDFTSADCNAGEPVVDLLPFTLSKEKALLDTFDISTTEETSIYCGNDSSLISFSNNSNIFEAQEGADFELSIYFKLDPRVEINYENSYIEAYKDENPLDEEDRLFYPPPFETDESGRIIFFYLASFSGFESFELVSVHLEFSCEK